MKQNPLGILKIYNSGNRKLSLEEIAEDLEQIAQIKKCSFCGCFAGTLKEFSDIAKENEKFELAARVNVLTKEVIKNKKYDCIGCNPCYPADISNLLFEINDISSEKKTNSSCGCSSDCSDEDSKEWPVEKGEFFVGNKNSSIAICTLTDTLLPKKIIEKWKEQITIAGFCETENIGIEKVVKNIITNSSIRYLILCGKDSGNGKMGHLSGQAILSLHKKGISEKGKIISAKGKRPFLKNVTPEQINLFRSQVEIVNLIGSTSLDEIKNVITVYHTKHKPPFSKNTVTVSTNKIITAQNPERLVLDKKGFFVIIPQKDENKIYVEYYSNNGKLLHTIEGTDVASIYYTIIEKGFISKLDHAAYLGKELTKAEYYLKYDIPFIQDKALGELVDE
jgi:tetrahydromethanopterin S-methyltransferase subunit A